MPDLTVLSLYFAAAFVLAVTPGPGMLYVLTRSVRGGRGEGYASSLGTAVGGLSHVIAAAFGISAVLAASADAYNVVKYAGAAYMIYLGIRTLLAKDEAFVITGAHETRHHQAFYQGIVTEVLNPKTALFFLAFIPQFVDTTRPVVEQFILLGCISVALNTSVDLIVATLAGPIGTQLQRRARLRRAQRIFTGSTLIALGAVVALSSAESA